MGLQDAFASDESILETRESLLRFEGSLFVCKLTWTCTCMFVYLLQAVARIDSGSGQASNNLPTAHPLLVRQTDGNLPGQ